MAAKLSMKKIKMKKGLSLNKETVSRLSDSKMENVKGGVARRTNFFCHDPSGGKSHCCAHSILGCNSYGCQNY